MSISRASSVALTAAPFRWDQGVAEVGRRTLDGPGCQHLARGVHRVAGSEPTHREWISTARLLLPADAVLAGWSAAWAHGLHWAAPDVPVEVIEPPGRRIRPRAMIRVRRDRLAGGEVVLTRFGPATSMARTAFDVARRSPPGVGLAVVDGLLRDAGLRLDDLAAVLERGAGRRGVRRAARILAAADPRAESPRESMLRWEILTAGLPPPIPQLVVRGRDRVFIGRLDLAWPAAKVGLEDDGRWPLDGVQPHRDLLRHNRLRAAGWHVFQADALTRPDPTALVGQLREALAGERHGLSGPRSSGPDEACQSALISSPEGGRRGRR